MNESRGPGKLTIVRGQTITGSRIGAYAVIRVLESVRQSFQQGSELVTMQVVTSLVDLFADFIKGPRRV